MKNSFGTANIDINRYEELRKIEDAYINGSVVCEFGYDGYLTRYYTIKEFKDKVLKINNDILSENDKLKDEIREFKKPKETTEAIVRLEIKLAIAGFIKNTSIWQFIKYKIGKS